MSMDGWSRVISTATSTSETSWVEETTGLIIGMQVTRYLALVSLTLLLYDIVSTMDMESKYVWSTPWNFGRIAFHFNRVFAPVVQILHLFSLFQYHPSSLFCVLESSIFVWGTIIIVCAVLSVLVVRVWLLYFRKPWVLITLLAVALAVTVPPVLVVLLGLKQNVQMRENPAPDVIPGCLFDGISKWPWIPYLGSTAYETVLFGLTAYKVHNAEYELPILNRLYRDGSCYYVVVLAVNSFTIVGSKIPLISGGATGSGFLGAVMSVMCSRMLLSTKSFEIERRERARELSVSETIRVPRSRRIKDSKDSNFWGIIEVDRTTLYVKDHQQDQEAGRDRDGQMGSGSGSGSGSQCCKCCR